MDFGSLKVISLPASFWQFVPVFHYVSVWRGTLLTCLSCMVRGAGGATALTLGRGHSALDAVARQVCSGLLQLFRSLRMTAFLYKMGTVGVSQAGGAAEAQLAECPPCSHRALGLVCSTTFMEHGGTHL